MVTWLTCKVCGKTYKGCNTINRTGAFRWQSVACSPEHGSIYLSMLMEARAPKNNKEEVEKVEVKQNTTSTDPDFSEDLLTDDESLDEYDEDELYEEDDEDFGDD